MKFYAFPSMKTQNRNLHMENWTLSECETTLKNVLNWIPMRYVFFFFFFRNKNKIYFSLTIFNLILEETWFIHNTWVRQLWQLEKKIGFTIYVHFFKVSDSVNFNENKINEWILFLDVIPMGKRIFSVWILISSFEQKRFD